MAAAVDLVEVDEVGVGLLGPAPRRLVLLAREDGHGDRDRDALRVEEAALVFPVETGRGDPGVRQPVERDVVEDFVARQLARGALRALQSGRHRGGGLAVGVVVVEKPGGEADGRVRDAVQGLRARGHHLRVLDLAVRSDQLVVRAAFLG